MLDEKDKKILGVLRENAKSSIKEVSKRTQLPITTVHNRIKKMEKNGVIKKYTVVLDKKKLGKEISAYVLASIDHGALRKLKITSDSLLKKIRNYNNVDIADPITGEYDIIIKISVEAIEKLDTFVTKYLRNLEGISRTQTMVVLSKD